MAVIGLAEFVRFSGQLGQVAAGLERGLRDASSDLATKLAADARARASGMGSVFAHVAPAIQSVAAHDTGEIDIDGVSSPAALGAEAGALRFPQFPPYVGTDWDGSKSPGYMLGATVAGDSAQIDSVFMESVLRLCAPAFPEG